MKTTKQMKMVHGDFTYFPIETREYFCTIRTRKWSDEKEVVHKDYKRKSFKEYVEKDFMDKYGEEHPKDSNRKKWKFCLRHGWYATVSFNRFMGYECGTCKKESHEEFMDLAYELGGVDLEWSNGELYYTIRDDDGKVINRHL